MWSKVEKTAKEVARNANAAAKMVAENEQFQAVAGKVQEKTKKVSMKINQHLEGKNKSPKNKDELESSRGNTLNSPGRSSSRNRSFRPFGKNETTADGEGDMSEIVWEDGSVKSIAALRVFGKDTTIVVADELKVSKKEKKNQEEGEGKTEGSETERTLTQYVPSAIEEGPPKVKLPVLIFPGMCSSGLYVENSGLDNKKYQGRRLWMNAGFLAESALGNKIVGSSRTMDARTSTAYVTDDTPRSSFHDNIQDLDRDPTAIGESERPVEDAEMNVEFQKIEEELNIRSAWLYHVSLDKNMVDERPGNRVRTYEGLKACEWLVDDAMAKPHAVVWADVTQFLEKEMGYIRGKNLDAVPYDWRLAPLSLEARDGYFTKTIERVERMYEENGDLPIVMACHSMGCRIGHYFLNYCLREKGRKWIDRHIHTYMPVGAPHCGAPLTARLGAVGSGLIGLTEDIMITPEDGVTMYRSWGSGPWLMPRDLPSTAFPSCIVRREGELGIQIASEIDVGSLFADREKKPKELRLTLVFRDKIRASTDFCPLKIDNEKNSMIVSFEETFYLAVPNLADADDNIGNLVFFLEEPSGGLYRDHKTSARTQFQNATKWARGFKKGVTKIYRNVAKKIGMVLQVAVCEKPYEIKVSAFVDTSSLTVDGSPVIEAVIPFCKCNGAADAKKIYGDNDESDSDDEEETKELVPYVGDEPQQKRRLTCYDFDCPFEEHEFGSLAINLRYTPPPDFQTEPRTRTAKFAVFSEEMTTPPLVNKKKKSTIVYEPWHARDLLDKDGFIGNMFDLHEEYYEQDPLGPTTKSALDAPPVNIVRSIYGINVPTEVGAIYRKENVVVIGDNKADFRYRVDKSARFDKLDGSSKRLNDEHQQIDPMVEEMTKGHRINNGIVEEMPTALQQVPGTTEKRRCCGDGTVPYWSLVHCLNWTDSVPTVTVDELEGAVHRFVLSDKRFHALLQQHITVDDPRNTALATIEKGVSKIVLPSISDTIDLKSYV